MTAPLDAFESRHLGPREDEVGRMLDRLGYPTLDALTDAAVPASIRTGAPTGGRIRVPDAGRGADSAGAARREDGDATPSDAEPLDLPPARTETEVLAHLRELASRNRVLTQMIGLGYHGTITPAVIRRNVLESPAWYTAYTPYQPEISQGRLEALLNFQTVVADLTGLPVANASLLDESTAVAEAVLLMRRAVKGREGGVVVLDADVLPQTLAVTRGRAEAMGLPLEVAELVGAADPDAALDAVLDGRELVGVVLQQPGASGRLADLGPLIERVKARDALVTVAADLLSLTLVVPPGELGADVAVGSAQRFGVPLFYGGPHAAYMAVRPGLERTLPGRLVGVSVDADGDVAYRLALQTREQHIRRERATSNICTAQALLAIVASLYAVYHGPEGLRGIARRVHGHATALAAGLADAGVEVVHGAFFDTVLARVPERAREVVAAALERGINVRRVDADHVAVACDEVTTAAHVDAVLAAFGAGPGSGGAPLAASGSGGAPLPAAGADGVAPPSADGARGGAAVPPPAGTAWPSWPDALIRRSGYLDHPVFHRHRSETSMLRYLRALADKDLALDRTMIPLGSCTMKLNATIQMEPISWPEFADLHPFVPADQAEGYRELIDALERQLAEITGYAGVSVQPNAGSQGEYAGLLAIRAYHAATTRPGEPVRDVCLIPASAHGTNAASAALVSLRVVVVATAEDGSVDLDDLRAKLAEHGPRVAAIMITYPSTHGVYEERVREVCSLVHEAGGQVYIDGANLNALVGLARPGEFGGDVSHLNLHKTFCIPHGGGGPGVGPVAVAEHLLPYLPGDPLAAVDAVVDAASGPAEGPVGDPATTAAGDSAAVVPPVSAAPYGSAGILPIPYAYIALMGPDGLRRATQVAVLTANYVAARLREHYPVLYSGPGGLVAHECILDLRPLTARTGVTAEDVAKRLMDYGFHAPTLSFPVAGTLMVEPTESEDLAELDRFCEALIAIRAEIEDVADGRWAAEDSPLRGAPHTAASVARDDWDRQYPREQAAFPVTSLRSGKYWPPVRRIDGARGDRNLVCSCPPIEELAEASR